MSQFVEHLAVTALRDYLLKNLPAKVTAINTGQARYPLLRSALSGDYTVPSGAVLKLNGSGPGETFTSVALTSGTRTAQQVCDEINAAAVPPIVGAATDTTKSSGLGGFMLFGPLPTSGTPTTGIFVGPDTTGANAAFGWSPGGEAVVRTLLVAPSAAGVSDGWPPIMDLGPGFWIIIGDRDSQPVKREVRYNEYMVALELVIVNRTLNAMSTRDRESISSCLRCVRELLMTEDGRRLGIGGSKSIAGLAGTGAIQGVWETKARIPGKPFSFKTNTPNPLFDLAFMTIQILVYEQPA